MLPRVSLLSAAAIALVAAGCGHPATAATPPVTGKEWLAVIGDGRCTVGSHSSIRAPRSLSPAVASYLPTTKGCRSFTRSMCTRGRSVQLAMSGPCRQECQTGRWRLLQDRPSRGEAAHTVGNTTGASLKRPLMRSRSASTRQGTSPRSGPDFIPRSTALAFHKR